MAIALRWPESAPERLANLCSRSLGTRSSPSRYPSSSDSRRNYRPRNSRNEPPCRPRRSPVEFRLPKGHKPMMGANGNLNFQQQAGFNARQAFGMPDAQRFEQAIQDCRRHVEQIGAHAIRQDTVLVFVMRQLDRKRRLQALATQLIAGEPDALKRLQQNLGLIFSLGPRPFDWSDGWLCFSIQQTNRELAGVTADLANSFRIDCFAARSLCL